MAEVVDSVKYPSLPSNYVSIAHLQERWLKEKEKEKQGNEEKEKQYPLAQNGSAKGWREVGKEAKLKEVEERVDGTRGKKKEEWKRMGCFVKRETRVERVLMIDVGGEEEMMGVEKGGKSSKGKCKEVEEEVGNVCMVGERDDVDRGIAGKNCGVGFKGKKDRGRRMGDGVGEVSEKGDCVERLGQERNGEKKKKVSVDVKGRTRGAFCAYGDKEVVGEIHVDRRSAGRKCGVGFRGKEHSWRRNGGGVGEASEKGESVERLGQERNGEKKKVSVDVKGKTNEKVRVSGAFCAYGDKEVEEVATVCGVEVVGESNVDRGNAGKRCGVRFRGKKHSGRKMGDGVGEVSDKAEKGQSVERLGQERNAEKEKVSVDEKVKVSGAFRAYGDKEVEEVATVCAVEVVGESKVDREITGQKCKVGFRGGKRSGRKMGDRVGEVSDKADSVEQSGQEHNAEKEEVSVDVKGRTNEKVKVSGAFHAYGDKEVEEVATVCTVEVVGENKLDKEIAGKKCRVGFRGKKIGWKRMGDRVGEVSDKADSVEQSEQECNAENEEVSVDVKERTNEKVRGRVAFREYSDKSIDVPLIDSEAGLKMKIERDLGDLSLSNRRYGHERSSVGVYDDNRRYASSRRYEPLKMLKQRDSSFVWVKKGESSNANVAEMETQVDFSGQSTGRSKLFSQ